MAVRARGAFGIKTLSAVRGCGVHSNERHVYQFQLGALELERTRRLREKQAAIIRIVSLDGRLLEIEAAIRRHQEALGTTSGVGRASPVLKTRTGASERRRTLRY